MGMFDSFYDGNGNEWQTKAYFCNLNQYLVGEAVPLVEPYDLPTYQVEVLGGFDEVPYTESFATVRNGFLTAVPAERDSSLPLLNYSGHLIEEAVA